MNNGWNSSFRRARDQIKQSKHIRAIIASQWRHRGQGSFPVIQWVYRKEIRYLFCWRQDSIFGHMPSTIGKRAIGNRPPWHARERGRHISMEHGRNTGKQRNQRMHILVVIRRHRCIKAHFTFHIGQVDYSRSAKIAWQNRKTPPMSNKLTNSWMNRASQTQNV